MEVKKEYVDNKQQKLKSKQCGFKFKDIKD